NAGISVGKYQISQALVQTLITGLVHVITIYLGARLIITGQGFSVGMLYAFLSFRQTFSDRAVGFINQLVQFRLLGLHLDRLADIITAVPEPDTSLSYSIDVKGGIKIHGLPFRYGAADQLVLQDVDLDIRPGELVAFTG